MTLSRDKLESYRDLLISHSELNECGMVDLWTVAANANNPISVCKEHVVKLLDRLKVGVNSEDDLLKWVYTIRWTGLFGFCDSHRDAILGILDNIAFHAEGLRDAQGARNINITQIVNGKERASLFKPITDADIDRYRKALEDNTEL